MKNETRCPKCGSLRIGRLQGVVETNLVIDGPDAGLSHPGQDILRDAYICGQCGYYETYVRTEDLALLENYPDFSWLGGQEGPFR